MSSPEATHANHSAPQESAEDQTTRDIYGPKCSEPLAFYDPELRSWRMSGVITLWGLTVSLETLPTSGMTVSGRLFRRSPWVRHIAGSGSSAWPTPTARDVKGASGWKKPARNLADLTYLAQIADGHRMWPTPTAHPDNSNKNGKFKNPTLGDAVRMWPTPTYGKLAGGSGANQRIEDIYQDGQITLEEKKAMQAGNGGRLNPMWVEWLMGFPLGWTDLED